MAGVDFQKIQSVTFFSALVGITLLFLWMLRPYLYPVFWAAVLATMFQPVYLRLLKQVKRPSAAAGLTELVIVLIFIVPLTIVVYMIVQQAIAVYATFGNQATLDQLNASVQHWLARPWIQ